MKNTIDGHDINLNFLLINAFLAIFSVVIACELISILSIILGHISVFPLPWTFAKVLLDGMVLPVMVALLLTAAIVSAAACYFVGGLWRWVAWLIVSVLALSFVASFLSVLIFKIVAGAQIAPFPWYIIWLFDSFPSGWLHHKLVAVTTTSFVVVFVIALFGLIYRNRREKKIFGDAHFASALEISKAGLFKKEGVLVGQAWGKKLFVGGFEHILVFAPSGSGKTRSIATPNLFNYQGSVVVNDVKKTLFENTAGYRERVLGQKCFLWALSWSESHSVATHRFNPFDLIPDNPLTRMKEIQRHAYVHIPDGKGDKVWYSGSRKLFKALTLYLLDAPEKQTTLGEMNRLIKQENFDGWLEDLLENTDHYDPEFYRNAHSYINNHHKTRTGIIETFSGYFELYDDPIIDAATSATDFDIRNLRREKMTIYVAFSDDDKERLAPLLTIFWQQVVSSMIQKIPDPQEEPYSVMFIMDEFSSLGRVNDLRETIKLLREYRIRLIIMIQYIAQTMEKYTQAEAKAFLNTKTRIAFALDDPDDAAYVSKLLGTKTIKVRSGSTSHSGHGLNQTASYNYQGAPLMRAEEVQRLKGDQVLIMRSSTAPILGKQCIWYKDRTFKNLQLASPAIPEHKVVQAPFVKTAKNKEELGLKNRIGGIRPSAKDRARKCQNSGCF